MKSNYYFLTYNSYFYRYKDHGTGRLVYKGVLDISEIEKKIAKTLKGGGSFDDDEHPPTAMITFIKEITEEEYNLNKSKVKKL